MIQTINFKKEGHDSFIDFLKAYSIVCVLLAHAIPHKAFDYIQFMVWGGMQVPMFILIQVYHVFKQGNRPGINFRRLWKRIVLPFLMSQIIIFVLLLLQSPLSYKEIVLNTIASGGNGPGSYFIWIYLQIALLLPILWSVCRKYTRKQLITIFVGISVLFDILFSIINLPQPIYRLLATRYFFLIFLGLNWVGGARINRSSILFSLLSLCAVEFFMYNTSDLEPIFFTTGWKTHRWVCYYYVAILLPTLLNQVFDSIKHRVRLLTFITKIGQCSYEIYLVQMAVFIFFPSTIASYMDAGVLRSVVLITSELIACILLGILLKDKIMPYLIKL